MKKNVMMRVASALLVAVLMTTCGISGTFAKYTTSDSATDSARVAKWGVTVEVTGDDAFAIQYKDQAGDNGTQVVSTVNVVAPGTKGVLATGEITGEPEVAVNVTKTAILTLNDKWVAEGVFYCPIIITVKVTGEATKTFTGTDYANAGEFKTAVEGALNASTDFAANDNLAYEVEVTWEWAFSEDDAISKKDTALGNAAADGNAPTIELEYSIAVNQVD